MARDYFKYIGLEFDDRGRGPNKFDCWGLVRHVLKNEFNIDVPSYALDYTSSFDKAAINELIEAEYMNGWEHFAEPKEGDVVVLRIGGRPWHCGLMISNRMFIHCDPNNGAVIESIDGEMWKRRIGAFLRKVST